MNQGKKDDEIRIIIDRKPYDSPSPTTHAALYQLGNVQAGYELFKEVHGNNDDDAIPNDGGPITLKPGDHFYSAQVTLNPGA